MVIFNIFVPKIIYLPKVLSNQAGCFTLTFLPYIDNQLNWGKMLFYVYIRAMQRILIDSKI
tara:strand:+ start:4936 stop:5118 length:183 start_codon:yes stop_codon:yes gene_type:complete